MFHYIISYRSISRAVNRGFEIRRSASSAASFPGLFPDPIQKGKVLGIGGCYIREYIFFYENQGSAKHFLNTNTCANFQLSPHYPCRKLETTRSLLQEPCTINLALRWIKVDREQAKMIIKYKTILQYPGCLSRMLIYLVNHQ